MRAMLYLNKEIKYGMRSNRFLILAVGMLFFALLDPVMTKVILPMILKSQFPEATAEALAGLMNATQLSSMQTYMGDMFEIGTVIVVFTLCGTIAQEVKDGTFILPVCSGKTFAAISGAKLVVYGAALIVISSAAMLADWVYSGALMGFEVNASSALAAGLTQGLYMTFIFCCLMVLGAFIKKPVAAGILTLVIAYGSHFIGGAFGITKYIPSGLMDTGIITAPNASLIITAVIAALTAAAFFMVTVLKLNRSELSIR